MIEPQWKLENMFDGTEILMNKYNLKVGRQPVYDLKTDSTVISRNHASISILADGLLYVIDNRSTNGTYVNDKKVVPMEMKVLNDGDTLSFGLPVTVLKNEEFKGPYFMYKVIKIGDSASSSNQTEPSTSNSSATGMNMKEASVCSNTNNISTTNTKDISVYTTNDNDDDFILISDDEEDEFACSQIFHISTQIKQEPNDGVDPYKEIKEELNDLDYCDVNYVPTVLTDDIDHFESTSQLLNILETTEASEMNDQNLIDTLEDSFEVKTNESNNLPVPSSSDNKRKSEDSTPNPVVELQVVLQKQTQSKYVKPPVVEPHFKKKASPLVKEKREYPKRKSLDKKPAEPAKRQRRSYSVDSKSIDNAAKKEIQEKRKQRLKEIADANKPDVIVTSPKVAKTTAKVKVSESRGEFLLSESKPSTSGANSENEKNNVSMNKKEPIKGKVFTRSNTSYDKSEDNQHNPSVVVTDKALQVERTNEGIVSNVNKVTTRSNTLNNKSEDNQPNSSVVTDKALKVEKTNEGVISNVNKVTTRSSTKSEDNQHNSSVAVIDKALHESFSKNKKAPTKLNHSDQKYEHSLPSTSNSSNRSDPRLRKLEDKLKFDDRNKTEHVPDSTVSDGGLRSDYNPLTWLGPSVSNPHRINPDSTVNEDKTGLIWRISSNCQPHKHDPKSKHYDVDSEISEIIKWNVSWLIEQKNVDISPPVNGKNQLLKVPLSFSNFDHYKLVMSQLVMLELWQYVFQTTFNGEEVRKPISVNIEHVRAVNQMSNLDCIYQLPKDKKNVVPFRQDDFCLIELRLKDSQNSYMYTGFGFIKSLSRHNFGNILKFTVVTKYLNRDITSKHMYVKVVANIASYLRLFKTIKYLEDSALRPYVLEPEKLISAGPIRGHSVRNTPMLNPIQKEISVQASEMALDHKPSFYLIKGPPGTGKSSVIVSVILEILHKAKMKNISPHILVTAPSNAAIDSLILKLNQTRCELQEKERKIIKIVRIGPDSSISELVNRFTLSFQSRKQLIIEKNLRKEYSQVENQMDMDEFLKKHLGNQFQYDMKNTQDKVLMGANLICTTLNSCVSFILNQLAKRGLFKYTCCIVDEATQCNEIEGLLPLQLGIDKFILVGDPQQLPAVICNKDAQQLGFGKSIFSRMYENFTSAKRRGHFPLKILCDQYRMLPEICDYPNRAFYEGKLNSHPKIYRVIEPRIRPYLVFNLTKCESNERSDYINVEESYLIRNLLETLRVHVKPTCEYSIGIITPYKAQKDLVTKRIADIKMHPKVTVTVNTVDSFQGCENDIIIISCVRNSSNYFLANEQRLNVALTRAKQALYIVGNYTLFKQCKPLYDLREDAKRRKLLLDIKDNPRQIPLLHKHILREQKN